VVGFLHFVVYMCQSRLRYCYHACHVLFQSFTPSVVSATEKDAFCYESVEFCHPTAMAETIIDHGRRLLKVVKSMNDAQLLLPTLTQTYVQTAMMS